LPEKERPHYEGKIKDGNILISVHTENSTERSRAEEERFMQTSMMSKVVAVFLCGIAMGITGCVQKGPAQRAGEKIDNAADALRDTVDPPGPAQKAGRAVDRALDNTTR
jgi:hypothetical protein